VDLSSELLALARRWAQVYGLDDRITFYEANAERLSQVVPSGVYDLVYSFGVIHHTPNPERVIEQIRQNYVAPGSTLKVMGYHRYSWKVFWIWLTEGRRSGLTLNEVVARNSEAQLGCPVTYTYTRQGAGAARP